MALPIPIFRPCYLTLLFSTPIPGGSSDKINGTAHLKVSGKQFEITCFSKLHCKVRRYGMYEMVVTFCTKSEYGASISLCFEAILRWSHCSRVSISTMHPLTSPS